MPAAAQFYKYVDKDGNIHFTDDINQVPPEQRAKIRSYEESESNPEAGEATPQAEEPQNEEQQPDAIAGSDESGQASLEDTRKRLEEWNR